MASLILFIVTVRNQSLQAVFGRTRGKC